MGKRFTVKEKQDMFIVFDALTKEDVKPHIDYDDALFDAKCRNEDEEKYGDE